MRKPRAARSAPFRRGRLYLLLLFERLLYIYIWGTVAWGSYGGFREGCGKEAVVKIAENKLLARRLETNTHKNKGKQVRSLCLFIEWVVIIRGKVNGSKVNSDVFEAIVKFEVFLSRYKLCGTRVCLKCEP